MATPLTLVRCPNCKSQIQAPVEQVVDVGHDPSAKTRLLSGTLNKARCSVCGFEGQFSTPIVYHDPDKELLLTYMPLELNLGSDEQERTLGRLITGIVDRLEPDDRKGYLLQPQAALTLQGLVERILEEDGISKEDLEAQKAKMRLFEDLLRTPEAQLDSFVAEHDEALDSPFFQLATLTIQTTEDQRAREALNTRLEQALQRTSFGKKIQAQESELRAAAESLQVLGEQITQEDLLSLLLDAPNDDRVVALVNLTRPAIDYSFFQQLTERIEQAEGDEQDRIRNLRQRILEITERLDKVQEARVAQATSLLQSLLESENLDEALQSAVPLIDDLFLSILQANIRAARERNETELLEKFESLDQKLMQMIEAVLPAGLKLAQKVLSIEDEKEALSMLDEAKDEIDQDLLNALMTRAQRMAESNDEAGETRLMQLYSHALKLSMESRIGETKAES